MNESRGIVLHGGRRNGHIVVRETVKDNHLFCSVIRPDFKVGNLRQMFCEHRIKEIKKKHEKKKGC